MATGHSSEGVCQCDLCLTLSRVRDLCRGSSSYFFWSRALERVRLLQGEILDLRDRDHWEHLQRELELLREDRGTWQSPRPPTQGSVGVKEEPAASEEEEERPREARHQTPTSPVSSSKEDKARRHRSTSSEGHIRRLIAKSKEATEERAEGEERREEASHSREKEEIKRDLSRWAEDEELLRLKQLRRGEPEPLPGCRRPAGEEEREDPAVLRRPAGREVAPVEERFERGESVNVVELPRHLIRPGQSLIVVEGNYWEAPVTLCGTVERVEEDGAGVVVEVRLLGTENEDLLKWSTGNPASRCKLHMCGDGCVAGLCEDGLVHVKKVRLRLPGAGEAWLDNLVGHVPIQVDDMAALRREGQRAGQGGFEGWKKEQEGKGKGDRRYGEEEGEKRELSAVFGNTGMDPDVKVRRQVVRKVKKSLRLLQRQMDTSDRDSSGEESTEEEDAGVFEEAQRIRRVGVRGPGVLAAASINEMKKSLVAASGQLWGQNRDLAPVGVHYFRTVLQLKLHGAMAREAFTLAYGADLAQGRVAEAIDLLLQRLKSLEQVSQGMPWQTAQKMELCPLETAQTAVALIRAAEDGSLDKALRETLGGSKDTELEDLREQARSTLLQGAKDGSLQAALKSTREDGKVEELRIQARDALLRASMSGALEKALGQGKTPKAAKATPAFQMEKPAFKFTPSVGSWLQRKPPQVEKPWYYTAVPVQAEDVKVVKDLQAVIAEKDHEIEALKAKIAAGGLNLGSAPALPPPAAKAQAEASAPMKSAPAPAKNKETSLANFRQYYVDQVLCTSALSSLEKLYSKFPAQPKPKPAPKPAASPVASAPRFALKPSVGTWLAPAPKKPSAAAAPPAASASAASATPFILKPSVGTWYMIKPFEERPKSVDILERTHSKLLTMDKEELITGFEKAIKKRDQEINNLKSTLKA
ncbi:unnamed protein product [Effrenium voratum]|uniref:Uncharacterized protein n=1 Tax=Effrenium voratum TaxID=2562239 RepID=A0AA36JQE0_9DINO|nr:unnamed protein product [Effrenium voratum]